MKRTTILALLVFATTPRAGADSSDSGNWTVVGQAVIGGTMTVQGGAFSVGGSTLSVSGGNVGVGTLSPAGPLDVYGSICISGNCISSWPSGGGTPYALDVSTNVIGPLGIGGGGTGRTAAVSAHVRAVVYATTTSSTFGQCVSATTTVSGVSSGDNLAVTIGLFMTNYTAGNYCAFQLIRNGEYINGDNSITSYTCENFGISTAATQFMQCMTLDTSPAAGTNNYCVAMASNSGTTCYVNGSWDIVVMEGM
jgi:hypothetical protein